ncbi:hypothetical protein CMK11_12855 [Candidatus Poribacteria bacterium]|nr:hypothetical protein [Candidatus Poribacteria bacterium]
MPDRIDEFESVFRSADRTAYQFLPPPVRRALVLSDRPVDGAQAYEARVRAYVESGDPDTSLEWDSWHGEAPDTRQGFVDRLSSYDADLVVTHRNLHDSISDAHFGLGVYVHVLTQSTRVPVLVTPSPDAPGFDRATRELEDAVLFSDHIDGDDRLVNWAVNFVSNSGALVFANVEPLAVFERYMHAISRIPGIETEMADTHIRAELLKEAEDYIAACRQRLADVRPELTTTGVARMGEPLEVLRELLPAHNHALVVMESEDDRQIAMRGLAAAAAVEFADISMLLI